MEHFVWFEDVHVMQERLRLMCVVAGRVVPLPVVILHPDCTLAGDGDVGRLGVPRWWAEQRGLCAYPPARSHWARCPRSRGAAESAGTS